MSIVICLSEMRLGLLGVMFLILAGVGGCSVVNIYDSGVRVQQKFGLPIYNIESSDSTRPLFIESSGVGVITSPSGVSVGYAKELYLSIPRDKCTAVFIGATPQSVKKIQAALAAQNVRLDQICLFPTQGHDNE